MTKVVDYIDLVGTHYLTGFDVSTEKNTGYFSDRYCDAFIFELDGITYKAIEDPDDGYRSYLGNFMIVKEQCKNKIPTHKVIGKLNTSSDIIDFYDYITKENVLSIGTDHSDNYYPFCIMEWCPESFPRENKEMYDWCLSNCDLPMKTLKRAHINYLEYHNDFKWRRERSREFTLNSPFYKKMKREQKLKRIIGKVK